MARIPSLSLGGLAAGLAVLAISSLASVAVHAAEPRGIIALNQFGHCPASGPCGALRPDAASNPAISGLMIRLEWKQIQTGPKASDIDWTMTDSVFAQAAKGQFVVLSFVPGIQTPDWAMDQIPSGGKMTLCIPYGSKADVGQQRTLPKPWNAEYQKLWYGFLKAVADRYAGKPQFLMIAASGPTSVSEEMSLPGAQQSSKVCSTNDAIQAWMKAGYTPDKYVGAWSDAFAKYAALFPNQYVSLALYRGLPIAAGGGSQDPTQVRETPQAVIAAGKSALGAKFAVEANGLIYNSAPNMAYQLVQANSGKAVTGFELATSADVKPQTEGGVADPAQALCLALKAGLAAKVDFLEVYQEDASTGDVAVNSVLTAAAKDLQPRTLRPWSPGRPIPLMRRRGAVASGVSHGYVCQLG